MARKLENAIATTQGLKHIYTKVQDGIVTITAEFRLEKPVQEAVDDVRSAVAQVCAATCRATCANPSSPRWTWRGSRCWPLPSARSNAAMRPAWTTKPCPGSSTTTSRRKLLAVRGVGAVNRVGGVNARSARGTGPVPSLQALGATAADISQPVAPGAGGKRRCGRTDLGGSEQPVRTIATVKTVRRRRSAA